jgi:hypothetical protein
MTEGSSRMRGRAVRFGPRDVLATVGDFVARGPGSWDVAGFLRDTPNAFASTGFSRPYGT